MLLFSNVAVISSQHIKSAWQADPGVELTEEVLREGMERIYLGSINAIFQLIQFKVMRRLHYALEKINKIYLNLTDICDRCQICARCSNCFVWLFRHLSCTALHCTAGPNIWHVSREENSTTFFFCWFREEGLQSKKNLRVLLDTLTLLVIR